MTNKAKTPLIFKILVETFVMKDCRWYVHLQQLLQQFLKNKRLNNAREILQKLHQI